MTDNDDWNFKVKPEARNAEGKKIKNKKSMKPLLNSSNKLEKLQVHSSIQAERKSRRQMVRDAGGTSMGMRDVVEAAPHGKRFVAFIIDILVLLIIIAIGQFGTTFFPGVGLTLEEFLGPEIISSVPFDLGGLIISLVLHFFLVIIPMGSTQKTIGKKLMKIKVLGLLKPVPPLGVIIIREYIGKPIAIISVIGLVIIFLNKKRRGLHDFIAGTFLIKL